MYKTIVIHEIKLLRRNTMMWFRFALFYLVFVAAMATDAIRGEWDRFSITLIGLIVISAVGVASALSAESFAHEKERGTMEAVLLAPTSANALVRAKTWYVATVAFCGVLLCFLSGVLLPTLLADYDNVSHALNRATLMTAFVACPPAIFVTSAIGSVISCRVDSLQKASTAATLSAVGGMFMLILISYFLTTGTTLVMIFATLTTWTAAWLSFRTAISTANPTVMIRTRGR